MRQLPEPFQELGKEHPQVYQAYEALAKAVHESGPLDERTRRLVKLAISVGARLEGAVRSHTWQAKEAGVTDAEIDQVVLLSLTTIGLPSMVAARTWVASALREA
ncbi:MAG TPA: carboxymuconolactone decarboxylase family protein [Dehalococcoidia bacterium]|nr:carboxymuconolactone decarboxylase family protein [Dehalococcoidia bacterium]